MDLWNLRDGITFRDLRLALGRHPETGEPRLLFMVQRGFGEYPPDCGSARRNSGSTGRTCIWPPA
ncbi:hypothetical protein [Deinococcus apachensis]|uniref:hypothetical protein n=1 Tax=Deinococcus apachensis TaxID=309886 RepID=UPI00035E0048|nr:hypothetical protein [Deinococcus apachensis]